MRWRRLPQPSLWSLQYTHSTARESSRGSFSTHCLRVYVRSPEIPPMRTVRIMEHDCDRLFPSPAILTALSTPPVADTSFAETTRPMHVLNGSLLERQPSRPFLPPAFSAPVPPSAACLWKPGFSRVPLMENRRRSGRLQEDPCKRVPTREPPESAGTYSCYYYLPPFLPAVNLLPHCERFSLSRRRRASRGSCPSVSGSEARELCLPAWSAFRSLNGGPCPSGREVSGGRTLSADVVGDCSTKDGESTLPSGPAILEHGVAQCAEPFLGSPLPSFYPSTPEEVLSKIRKPERLSVEFVSPVDVQTHSPVGGFRCLEREDRAPWFSCHSDSKRTHRVPGQRADPRLSGLPSVRPAAQRGSACCSSSRTSPHRRKEHMAGDELASGDELQKTATREVEGCLPTAGLPKWSVAPWSPSPAQNRQRKHVALPTTEKETLPRRLSMTGVLRRGEQLWGLMKWLAAQKSRGEREFLRSFQETSSCFFARESFRAPLERRRSSLCSTERCPSPTCLTRGLQTATGRRKARSSSDIAPRPCFSRRDREADRCREKHQPHFLAESGPASLLQNNNQPSHSEGRRGREKADVEERLGYFEGGENRRPNEVTTEARRPGKVQNRTALLAEDSLLCRAPANHPSNRQEPRSSLRLWEAGIESNGRKPQLKTGRSSLSPGSPPFSSSSPVLTRDPTFSAPSRVPAVVSCSLLSSRGVKRDQERKQTPAPQSEKAGSGLFCPSKVGWGHRPAGEGNLGPVFVGAPPPEVSCNTRNEQRR